MAKRLKLVLSAIIFFSFPLFLSAQSNIYQVFSLDDQFVVYSEDPSLAQEGALSAEKVRTDLFQRLGWISYSQYPTQIWLLKGEPSSDASIQSSLEWKEGGWVKTLRISMQENLYSETLPRYIIEIFLKELALGSDQERSQSVWIPLWLVEGLRQSLTPEKSTGGFSTLAFDLPQLFLQEEVFTDSVRKEQFAKPSQKFLDYLLELPDGQKKLKQYIRLLAISQSPEKTFFQVYQSDFKDFQELKFSWNKKWYATSPKKERHELILEYLDSLEAN